MPPTAAQEGSVSCHYPRDLTAARSARADVRSTLLRWGLEVYADDGQAIVSELVANAVTHGAGPVDLYITDLNDGRVLMQVHDHGPSRPDWSRKAKRADERGRGLKLVVALVSDTGGYSYVQEDIEGQGKSVCVLLGHARRVSRPGQVAPRQAVPAAGAVSR